MQYEKVYIQKMRDGSPVMETIADFDIYCAEMPFKLFVEVKDPAKREWVDKDKSTNRYGIWTIFELASFSMIHSPTALAKSTILKLSLTL